MKKPTKFSDLYIKSLQPRANRFTVFEKDGFGIRVSPTGRITFCYEYKIGKTHRRLTLGPYPSLKLGDARKLHRDALTQREKGLDPALLKKQEREGISRDRYTVRNLVDEYIERWAKPNKKTWENDKRALEFDVIPKWEHRIAAEITRRDVALLLDGIMDRGAPRQANVVFSMIRRMFNFAIERGILENTPCYKVRRPAEDNVKNRHLSDVEIRGFWFGMNKTRATDAMKNGLRLILTTGQRPGEAFGICDKEICGDWWTLPDERNKGVGDHRIFLSPLAKQLIGTPTGLSFPSSKKNDNGETTIFTKSAIAQAVRRSLPKMGAKNITVEPFTPHDLRRTATTIMSRLGHSAYVSKVLGHVDSTVTGKHYDQNQFDPEKQAALTDLGKYLQKLIKKGPLAGKAKRNKCWLT